MLHIFNASSLRGVVVVGGDKSISHRALILAACASGVSKISNLSLGQDVLMTAKSLMNLGVKIVIENNICTIYGVGISGLKQPNGILNMGNSGSSARFLLGLLAGYNYRVFFDGDDSLRKRSMQSVMDALQAIGAEFTMSDSQYLPGFMNGGKWCLPIKYDLLVPRAQIKTAILFAGLNIDGTTTIIEHIPTRNHSEKLLKFMGADINIEHVKGRNIITLRGGKDLKSREIAIPNDPSSAAFIAVAALIVNKSEIKLLDVNLNETRSAIWLILQQMGAKIKITNSRYLDYGEEIGDLEICNSDLSAIEINASYSAKLIDEYPILAIAAACADGVSIFRGIGELRYKESNRIDAIVNNLRQIGIEVKIQDDDMIIKGNKLQILSLDSGLKIETYRDHRIAMAFSIIALITKNGLMLDDCESINTSFPNFLDIINHIGGKAIICDLR
jgi:3-phosphoshikimate 1-carboxyvinyltransferase